jgi:hypothetical protein
MSKRRIRVVAPRLTSPARRGLTGGLYSAKLLFEYFVTISGKAASRRLCEERLILIKSQSAERAYREATRQARESQHSYRNSSNNRVQFRFVGVMDLLHLGVECEANEVWYNIGERIRPMERRSKILPKRHDLNAIKNEMLLKK